MLFLLLCLFWACFARELGCFSLLDKRMVPMEIVKKKKKKKKILMYTTLSGAYKPEPNNIFEGLVQVVPMMVAGRCSCPPRWHQSVPHQIASRCPLKHAPR